MQFEISKELISHLEDAIQNQDKGFIEEHLGELHAADISTVLYELNSDESKYIIDLWILKLFLSSSITCFIITV